MGWLWGGCEHLGAPGAGLDAGGARAAAPARGLGAGGRLAGLAAHDALRAVMGLAAAVVPAGRSVGGVPVARHRLCSRTGRA